MRLKLQLKFFLTSIQLTTILNSCSNPQQELQFNEVLEELGQNLEVSSNSSRSEDLEEKDNINLFFHICSKYPSGRAIR
jgi:hypothetical protein